LASAFVGGLFYRSFYIDWIYIFLYYSNEI